MASSKEEYMKLLATKRIEERRKADKEGLGGNKEIVPRDSNQERSRYWETGVMGPFGQDLERFLAKYQHNEEKIKELKETLGIQGGQVDHMSAENVNLRRRNAMLQKRMIRHI
jgi:hypothetical protein